MKVGIASDHGGLAIKKMLVETLTAAGYEIIDFGPYNTESVDYPDYAQKATTAYNAGEIERGILVCGTGIGMSIAANKVKGIRCALVHDVFTAKVTKEHNDTNFIAMGERVIGPGLAELITKTWLAAEFEGGRHSLRIDKVMEIEQKNR